MSKLPIWITQEEFVKLIKHTKRLDHKIGFLLGFGSGLRLSEIVGLEEKGIEIIPPLIKEKINLNDKSIRVLGKGQKERIVPLPKGFKTNMIPLLPLNKKYKNISSARRGFQRAFKIAAEKAGLLETNPKLHLHSLRHGFGSRLADQNVPLTHIQVLMGHSKVSTTSIYLHANPKDALKSYEELF